MVRRDRLYDAFISSTQIDLENERAQLARTLSRTNFRPIAMEYFPASRRSADQLIEKLVLKSDFLILILGFTYGSIVPGTSVSFTELEFDRARAANIPVLAFLKKASDGQELSPEIARFRDRVTQELTCQFWRESAELNELVLQSLEAEVEDTQPPGWVRGEGLGLDPVQMISQVTEPSGQLGITRVSLDGVAGAVMGQRLRVAKEIRIISTVGHRLIEAQREALIGAVRNDADFRMLTPLEDGLFASDVEEIEQRNSPADKLATETEMLRNRLHEIARSSHGHGSIALGRMTTQLRVTATTTENWGWLSLTLPPLRTSGTASFELVDAGERSLLHSLHDHFDAVWEIVSKRGDLEHF
jgi:Domain of unknown function (DUF4062)